jgi:3-oxoadipate enol-lactonase
VSRGKIVWFGFIAWVAWRMFGREPQPRFVGRQTRPGGPTGRTILAGRHEFLVRESGPEDAPPIVLLHGWLYDAHATWHRIVPVLAEHHRVITIDLRNHGKTDRIRSRFDITDLGDDIARTLDVLGLAGVPVVGYSMGGMVAQALAIRHPGRVSRLVLGATAARPVTWPRWSTVPAMLVGRTLSRIDRFLLPRIAHQYMTRTGVIPPEHSAWLWEHLVDRDVDLYYEGGFAILRFDARDRVGQLDVPTLCIIPTADQLVMPRQQYETASLIPGARVVEIVGGRHEAVLTHSDDVAKAILEFGG